MGVSRERTEPLQLCLGVEVYPHSGKQDSNRDATQDPFFLPLKTPHLSN